MSPGYEPIETSIDLTGKRAVELPPFHLLRSKGALEVQSEPAGAQISIRSEDGKTSREGTAPQSIVDLPTGKYSVIARRGDWEMRDDVEVQRGATATKSFAFVSAMAKITSEPSGAEISVDGKPRGKTPLRRWIRPPMLPQSDRYCPFRNDMRRLGEHELEWPGLHLLHKATC